MAMYDTEAVPVMETGGPPPSRKSPNFLWPAVDLALLLPPDSQQATVPKTGGRNIIRRRWTVPLMAAPHLREDHLYAASRDLLQNILTHNE